MNRKSLSAFFHDENGQDNIEYGLLASLVAIVVLVLLYGFKSPLSTLYEEVLNALNLASG